MKLVDLIKELNASVTEERHMSDEAILAAVDKLMITIATNGDAPLIPCLSG